MYERNGANQEVDHITASRVNMLISIYDAAIDAIDDVLNTIEIGSSHEATVARSQAIVLVGLIENGLDLSQGEIPNRIKDLCGFVEQALLRGQAPEIIVSRQVLKNLRDGFTGIKAEANKLESDGKIPQLSAACSIDTVI